MPYHGVHRFPGVPELRRFALYGLGILPLLLTACAQSNVSTSQLLKHQMQSNLAALNPTVTIDELRASVAAPRNWTEAPINRGLLYVHQQWRSPDHQTGFGVAYIHLPFPISPQILLFLAGSQYSKSRYNNGGHMDDQWTDSLGRLWFEATDAKYAVRGYAMTRGGEAWIVYSGHVITPTVKDSDVTMANLAADTVVPQIDSQPAFAQATPRDRHF
jgi:hypothetical protein